MAVLTKQIMSDYAILAVFAILKQLMEFDLPAQTCQVIKRCGLKRKELCLHLLRKGVGSWLGGHQKTRVQWFNSADLIQELPKLVTALEEAHHLMAAFSEGRAECRFA
jgi:hypothetical protein